MNIHVASSAFICSREQRTKMLIRLHGCAGWSALLFFAYDKIKFSCVVVQKTPGWNELRGQPSIWVYICCDWQFMCLLPLDCGIKKGSLIFLMCYFSINEPQHEISNNVICATSKASDQPALMCSLFRAFASRLNIL